MDVTNRISWLPLYSPGLESPLSHKIPVAKLELLVDDVEIIKCFINNVVNRLNHITFTRINQYSYNITFADGSSIESQGDITTILGITLVIAISSIA